MLVQAALNGHSGLFLKRGGHESGRKMCWPNPGEGIGIENGYDQESFYICVKLPKNKLKYFLNRTANFFIFLNGIIALF